MNEREKKQPLGIAAVLIHFVLFSFLWFILSDGSMLSWLIGVPFILAAVISAVYLAPLEIPRFNPLYLVVFFPVFLKLSIAGGVDVARRALVREIPLQPGLLEYSLRLAPGTPRIFFMLLISLLPGTLSADIAGDRLTVHVLDTGQDNQAELASLEEKVAHLFRIDFAGAMEDRV